MNQIIEELIISSVRDIVELNYNWGNSKDRFDGWSNPSEQWQSLLI